ncbi:hypothetical protein A2954_01825 [Candidatus Roizmanbacteria bacterium RIFCSPLOWO2_01_FULL_37_12]|uniref:Major facilitator superfamily (MFS) profile domain-containing protein n=1 Tax=Candidatus Roizmanbacteria bacterium RIFCSPLOWO2_01_FULL_37_12 TaxID=1802056 RepID=A0A1F7I9E1_9BACT|nr:MAG: hypothetical protein A2768_01125 [Candidatus Roizmanbacteria bacterium RIFCSPHIGHO2_01_FULL_37_16]OGK24495.1 MAG: hypothetical protein A3D76_05700 [Candidatus Roizmanbacteria bacterium RIFCSPHIGHO2_02_FULL_37_9b]OGK39986.1 MAG: hypothetical protein A2954_01825 [Candidatus Roizmanbacteria bacterium RIFCSPLOWO2_01_FULL_37_12]
MERNIKIAYVLTALKNSWFWLGIWVFYYLLFTNYAGIGILETLLFVGATATEIPTGAVADLLGKKKTLLLAFLLMTVGLFGIGFTPNFLFLSIGVLLAGIGMAFYSGTMEALIYDSLKEIKKEDKYPKVISNIGTLQLISPAVAGLLGGYLYSFFPRLPFLLHGLNYFIGLILCLFLIEPHIDTEKFSWSSFVNQTKQGFKELTKSVEIRNLTILLLLIGALVVIADEMLNSFLGVEFGFSVKLAGIFWSVIYIISSLSSQLTPRILKYFAETKSIILIGFLIGITFMVSPFIGLLMGGISLLFRSSLQAIFFNLASIVINKNTESNYRATTLSTFSMLKNIPYVCLAFFVGFMADKYTAKNVAFWLGIILFMLIASQFFRKKKV